jgi:hypothetical protein
MSMMKPVDNHTTSIGMTAIMGSRTGRFTRNDNSRTISVASTQYGSFLLAVTNKNFVQDGTGIEARAEKSVAPDGLDDFEIVCARRVALQARAVRRASLGALNDDVPSRAP